jgi:hypothetical protein
MLRWTILAFFVLACCRAGEAATVRVRVEAPNECTGELRVVATPETGKPVTARLVSDDLAQVMTLPDGDAAIIAVDHPRCWGDQLVWTPGDPTELTLAAHPAATMTGALGPAGRSVRAVRGHVHTRSSHRVQEGDTAPPPSVANAACTVTDDTWRCQVPAEITFDFRLEVPGFASQYSWDVFVRSGEVFSAEPQMLVPGASVTGWVVRGKDSPLRNARVSIYPRNVQGKNRSHSAAQMQTRRTDRRGFFQFAGLAPGTYRIVSEAAHLSPAVVPDLVVKSAEAITLPRPLRQDEPAAFDILIQPSTDRSGGRWNVELSEATPLYPERRPRTISRHANENGLWQANGLRADVYELKVIDGTGTVAHRQRVDLFDGGPGTLALTVRQIPVRGTLLAGDAPLEAVIHLSNESGILVKTASDADGRFEAALPTTGAWRPSVLYPRGPGGARIVAEVFEIPEDAPRDLPRELVLRLPGGRIHGNVVSSDQRKGIAVVHAYRGQRLVAEQQTTDDGKFNFVGLAAGTYRLDAQSAAGSTPRAVEQVLENDESREVTLVTEPYVRLSGYVVTPDGRPASGAVVQFSTDGVFWERMVADVRGQFGRDVPRGGQSVQMVVLSHGYPATMLASPVTDDPIRVQLRSDGGVIRFRSPAVLLTRGARAPAHAFRFESNAPFSGSIYLESGTYTVCPVAGAAGKCRSVTVGPSTQDEVDFRGPARKEGTV